MLWGDFDVLSFVGNVIEIFGKEEKILPIKPTPLNDDYHNNAKDNIIIKGVKDSSHQNQKS